MGNGKTDRPRDRATDIWKMTWREIKIKEQRDENIKKTHKYSQRSRKKKEKDCIHKTLFFT